jgi:prepilin-type N-terminal cleavage/methylation domain-containing protein
MKGGNQRLNGSGRQKLQQFLSGFTIIEVMIVMAVTGLLLTSAIVLVSGRQNQTEFQQAINQVTQQIQQVIDDVANGYYPNSQNFNCTPNPPTIVPGTTKQGANTGCIFLGKALKFNINNFSVYPVLGNRGQTASPSSKQVTTYLQAQPTLLNASGSATQVNLENGLTVKSMYYNNAGNPIGWVAFMSSLASYSGVNINSGSQQIYLMPLNTASCIFGSAPPSAINGSCADGFVATPPNDADICFASGTTNQSGLVTIAYGSGKLQATLSIKSGTSC